MNCDALLRLIDCVDDDARVDRDALARHLRRCPRCRRRFPEIGPLLAGWSEPATTRPGLWRRVVAAAALLLAAVALDQPSIPRAPVAGMTEVPVGQVRVLRARSTITTTTVALGRERVVTSNHRRTLGPPDDERHRIHLALRSP